MHFTDVLA